MKRTVQKILGIVFGVGLVAAAFAANPNAIIPAPVKAGARDGQFQLTAASRLLTDRELKSEGQLLAARLRLATGFALKIKSAKEKINAGDILLTTNGADASFGAEGYALSVSSNCVVIRAPAPAGIFYGTQSLLQLMPPEIFSATSANNLPLGCVSASTNTHHSPGAMDAPVLRARAI